MLVALFILTACSCIVWAAVMFIMAPSAWSIMTKRGCGMDPLWAFVFLLSLNRFWLIGHNLAYGQVYTPISALFILAGYHCFAIALGAGAIAMRHWYGRGTCDG